MKPERCQTDQLFHSGLTERAERAALIASRSRWVVGPGAPTVSITATGR